MALQIKHEEVTAILKKQLAEFDLKADTYETGTVISVGDGIARVHGLSNVMSNELVEFKGGIRGLALNLEGDNVGVCVFGEVEAIKEGDEVRRTGQIASVPVGDALGGRVVDALGNPIDGGPPIAATEMRPI